MPNLPSKSFVSTILVLCVCVAAALIALHVLKRERRMRPVPGLREFRGSLRWLTGMDPSGLSTYDEFVMREDSWRRSNLPTNAPMICDAERVPVPWRCPIGRFYVCVLERPAALLPEETPLMWDTTPCPYDGAMAVLFWDGEVTARFRGEPGKRFITAKDLKLLVRRLEEKCGQRLRLGFAWKDPIPAEGLGAAAE